MSAFNFIVMYIFKEDNFCCFSSFTLAEKFFPRNKQLMVLCLNSDGGQPFDIIFPDLNNSHLCEGGTFLNPYFFRSFKIFDANPGYDFYERF